MTATVIRADFQQEKSEMATIQASGGHSLAYRIEEGNDQTPSMDQILERFVPEAVDKGMNEVEDTPRPLISMKALYPDVEGLAPPYAATAIRILGKALSHLQDAIDAAKIDDWFASDNKVMIFENLLPELFCCRKLGDGFGAVINAVHFALKNRDDESLTIDQISAISGLMERVHQRPFLSFGEAVDQINALRKKGLNPRPTALDKLADITERTVSTE
jgi:hypothetical protein